MNRVRTLSAAVAAALAMVFTAGAAVAGEFEFTGSLAGEFGLLHEASDFSGHRTRKLELAGRCDLGRKGQGRRRDRRA